MKYSYDDFVVLKNGMLVSCCGTGKFGKDIYAVKIYNEVGNQFCMIFLELQKKNL